MPVFNRNLIFYAGKRTKFSFNHNAMIVCIFHNLTGKRDIVFKGLGGSRSD